MDEWGSPLRQTALHGINDKDEVENHASIQTPRKREMDVLCRKPLPGSLYAIRKYTICCDEAFAWYLNCLSLPPGIATFLACKNDPQPTLLAYRDESIPRRYGSHLTSCFIRKVMSKTR